MAVIPRSRNTHHVGSFYSGSTYTPDTIGDWIAVTDRDLPWHTIGAALDNHGRGKKATRLMTAADVLKSTGFDIQVQKYALQFADTGDVCQRVFVTGYDDPEVGRLQFGAVTDRYQVVQPSEALSFFDQVVDGIDGAGYSAAWNMREKSQMGVTIWLPDEVVVDPSGAADRTTFHLLGINSFDGSTGVTGVLTGTRPWCMNQLAMMLSGAKRRFSLRHTAKVKDRAAEAAQMIGMQADYIAKFDQVANALYAKPMDDPQFERFLSRIPTFDLSGLEAGVVRDRCAARRAEAIEAWRAPHNANITGTRWGALNVVAEYVEWGRNVRGSKRTGTDATRQRAIGTLVSPHVTQPVDMALEVLTAMR